VNVGDVHCVHFPPRGGHAQAGRRPAVIVQGHEATARLPTLLLVPLTTQLDALRFPGTRLIEVSPENGLPRASVALVFQLTAADARFVGERRGRVSDAVLQSIWSAFDEITERTGTRPAPSLQT
jgi:mRNA-degrading endonuclease toxin of MazEF toxin-antitoxin module